MLAWMPWLILTVFVFLWGIPAGQELPRRNLASSGSLRGLHNMVAAGAARGAGRRQSRRLQPQLAVGHGTGIFLSAIVAGFAMGY